jgi:hypothetical protein
MEAVATRPLTLYARQLVTPILAQRGTYGSTQSVDVVYSFDHDHGRRGCLRWGSGYPSSNSHYRRITYRGGPYSGCRTYGCTNGSPHHNPLAGGCSLSPR